MSECVPSPLPSTRIGYSVSNISRLISLSLVCVSLGLSLGAVTAPEHVAFPDGYRGWVHISSAVVASGPRGPGMHHIYANAKAIEGYRTGRFSDGATIVFDRFGLQVNGATTKIGDRQLVDVMVRDSARFRDTGGWGFDEFVGDSRVDHAFEPSKAAASCFTCHTQRRENGYVFTTFSDRERAAP